jgi:gamma-tubulin complex component 3
VRLPATAFKSCVYSSLELFHVALGHADIANLERTIDAAYSSASKRLLDIFFDRYKLLDHLQAMRNYILLCAGDFAELLLESLT